MEDKIGPASAVHRSFGARWPLLLGAVVLVIAAKLLLDRTLWHQPSVASLHVEWSASPLGVKALITNTSKRPIVGVHGYVIEPNPPESASAAPTTQVNAVFTLSPQESATSPYARSKSPTLTLAGGPHVNTTEKTLMPGESTVVQFPTAPSHTLPPTAHFFDADGQELVAK